MVRGHRIKEMVDTRKFLSEISSFREEQVVTAKHAFFHLKVGNGKIFKEQIIKKMVLEEHPLLVWLQYNRKYAAFYRYDGYIIRIILDVKPEKIVIVTYYAPDQIPEL